MKVSKKYKAGSMRILKLTNEHLLELLASPPSLIQYNIPCKTPSHQEAYSHPPGLIMAPVNSVSGTCELLEVIFIQQPMKDVLLS